MSAPLGLLAAALAVAVGTPGVGPPGEVGSPACRGNGTRAGRARRGSQLQMQVYVNRHPEALTESVLEALPSLATQRAHLRWVSPLERDSFAEHQDAAFLEAVGLEHLAGDLSDFWPAGGPVWDGLAVAELASGERGVVLAEGKSYPEELYGTGSKAGESGRERALANREKIVEALRETQEWLGLRGLDPEIWMGPLDDERASSSLYQTANRLAHLYWLVERAGQQAWLVHVLFVDDPTFRATSRETWEKASRRPIGNSGFKRRTIGSVMPSCRRSARAGPSALPDAARGGDGQRRVRADPRAGTLGGAFAPSADPAEPSRSQGHRHGRRKRTLSRIGRGATRSQLPTRPSPGQRCRRDRTPRRAT